MDYAYTIQGWIKGVNSNTLQSNTDIGKDGQSGTLNAMIGRDAFGYSLNYFAGDYQAISNPGALNNFIASTAAKSSILATDGPSLYNGNISSMVTAINSPGSTSTTAALTQLTAYQYDQLNRITQLKAYKDINMATNSWGAAGTDGSYQENYSYDANGNIMQLKRNGTLAMGLDMDSLTYHYETIANGYKKNTNKLRWIHDNVAAANYSSDIDDQTKDNYAYDEIGNLSTNTQEGILQINWNVYGKITDVIRADTSIQRDLSFLYDAQGNRIAKIAKPHATRTDATTWTTTWYSRDASGNVISTYIQTGANAPANTANTISFVQDEQMLYGSSRIGLKSLNSNMLITPAISSLYSRTIGMKQYEGTNHLGNVLSVFTDLPMGVSSGSNTIGLNLANIVQANDYYAFGMTMPGRSFSGAGYRYGFNGKELNPEMETATYDYGMRIYDARIGKFLSRDPLSRKYAFLTPYQFAGNSPVANIDLDGMEGFPSNYYTGLGFQSSLYNFNIKEILKNGQLVAAASLSKDMGLGGTQWNGTLQNTATGQGTFQYYFPPGEPIAKLGKIVLGGSISTTPNQFSFLQVSPADAEPNFNASLGANYTIGKLDKGDSRFTVSGLNNAHGPYSAAQPGDDPRNLDDARSALSDWSDLFGFAEITYRFRILEWAYDYLDEETQKLMEESSDVMSGSYDQWDDNPTIELKTDDIGVKFNFKKKSAAVAKSKFKSSTSSGVMHSGTLDPILQNALRTATRARYKSTLGTNSIGL